MTRVEQPLYDRLETGDIVIYPVCPFSLPQDADLRFLLAQEVGDGFKSISYFPDTKVLTGYRGGTAADQERLHRILAGFSRNATEWLAGAFARYRRRLRLGPLRFRPVEEEGRDFDQRYTGSLLHVDAFGDAVTEGESSLRIFANVNPTEPRHWITSDPLMSLLERLGNRVRLPTDRPPGLFERIGRRLRRRFGYPPTMSVYDDFMQRFHPFLKQNEYVQHSAPRKHWTFPPGSAWVVFSDIASHAVVRGRFAIDQTYFIPASAFNSPSRSAQALLNRFWATPLPPPAEPAAGDVT